MPKKIHPDCVKKMFYVEQAAFDKLELLSLSRGVSMSNIIRKLIRNYVEEQENELRNRVVVEKDTRLTTRVGSENGSVA